MSEGKPDFARFTGEIATEIDQSAAIAASRVVLH
jgi:hypothetical protein